MRRFAWPANISPITATLGAMLRGDVFFLTGAPWRSSVTRCWTSSGATARLVFVTHDSEFEVLPPGTQAAIVISRVPQRLPIAERIEHWMAALESLPADRSPGQLFEILPDGELVAWEER